MGCIFCKIAEGSMPGDILFQDGRLFVLRDISPQSPIHLLIIPKKHITSLADLKEEDLPLLGHMIGVANQMAKDEGILDGGYRLVINAGELGGQVVGHLHMHLMGGRQLSSQLG